MMCEQQKSDHISRRDFMRSTAATALMATLATGMTTKQRKPNLLFILTDQQRADTMAAYGNHRIHAPNLNKLCAESIVFKHSYVSQPVCTPARSTILTGLWPHTTGLTENNIALPGKFPTLPEIINDSDYSTAWYGKWHLGDELFAQRGFNEWKSIEDIYWRFFSKDKDIKQKSSYDNYLRSLGYKPDTDTGHFSRDFASRLSIEHSKPKFLERHACDFLRRHRSSPFMLYVSFLEPHSPFFGPLNDEHKPGETDLPVNFNDPPDKEEPEAYRRRYEKYLKNGFKGQPLQTDADWRQLTARYWGLVTQVDRSVGVILDTLERVGLSENTIVVYTSDHGEMMGSHRLVTKGVVYEEATRVPWIIRAPHFNQRQKTIDNPVSQIDLVPTLLDLMGHADKAKQRHLPGKSLVPLIEGNAAGNEYVFIEWNAGNSVLKQRNPGGHLRVSTGPQGPNCRAVVSPDGWKLCIHDTDRNQLFNLKEDPGETTNLIDSPQHVETIRNLMNKLRQWQQSVDDPLSDRPDWVRNFPG